MPAVIIRQLPDNPPVVHCIINNSTDPDVDDQEHYLQSKADDEIVAFKQTFQEFKQAVFIVCLNPKIL